MVGDPRLEYARSALEGLTASYLELIPEEMMKPANPLFVEENGVLSCHLKISRGFQGGTRMLGLIYDANTNRWGRAGGMTDMADRWYDSMADAFYAMERKLRFVLWTCEHKTPKLETLVA